MTPRRPAAAPLRVCIAPNAFKGTLSAPEAARCIARGLRAAIPRVECILVPVADGGDGTVEAIVAATGGRFVRTRVADPLGRPVTARWGLTGDGTTAVIELATAAGLARLTPHERNPLRTSTYGVGELIRRALDRGARRIVLGIGGSATNDGGTGIARALGARLLDRYGRELPPGGGALTRLERIDLRSLDPRLGETELLVACDVDNPLVGPRGAARVYAPQKGATPPMVRRLEAGLRRLATVVRRDLGIDIARMPGAGAAGGTGGGVVALLGAKLRPGAAMVLEIVRFDERVRGCDLVITGEGRLDAQTAFGKAPAAVARAARRVGIPTIALAGSIGPGAAALGQIGFAAWLSALEEPMGEAELRLRAPLMLERCAEQAGRLWQLGALAALTRR